MYIYHYYPDTGLYFGSSQADESPLEPGVFLIPAFATKDAPPKAKDGEQILFNGTAWDIRPISQPTPEPQPAPPTIAQLTAAALVRRDALLAEAALRIAPLQDAVDLAVATDAEIVLLKKWKLYRVGLNRIELQTGFPQVITWPEHPV